ncbi:hypothetical protein CHS0354_037993, partial [Potamilus streckersoni]
HRAMLRIYVLEIPNLAVTYSPHSGFFCPFKLLQVNSAQDKDCVLVNRSESTFPTLLKP